MNTKIIIGIVIAVLIVLGLFSLQGTTEEPVEVYTSEEATQIAEEWIRANTSTFTEREGENLTHLETADLGNGLFQVVFDFEAMFSGYGPVLEDEISAQVITPHTTDVMVEENEVVKVVTDGIYDEINLSIVEEEPEDPVLDIVTFDVYFVRWVDDMEIFVPVSRQARTGRGIEKSALVYLLEGPTAEEEAEGISTAIPENVELLSLDEENGIFILNFSQEIEPAGGSAWVMAIRDQIEMTLMQFETISELKILVEGEEDRLQP